MLHFFNSQLTRRIIYDHLLFFVDAPSCYPPMRFARLALWATLAPSPASHWVDPMTKSASTHSAPRRRGFLAWLLSPFSSVWFGIALAVVMFVYCSVGSAMPHVRQLPYLEMTEFEWFHWWPFNVLMALFCTTLVVVTIRRIPLRTVNLGVWMIHTGILTLCAGSYYYFGTKVEGDTPVFRRRLLINLPGANEVASLAALPGNHTSVKVGAAAWHFTVQSTNQAWPILSDEHKGEMAYAVNVQVTPPTGPRFIRQLLAGYPQYTEDIIPGKGRAIKSIGRKLVEEQLDISLDLQPQEYFHVMKSWGLFVRRVGDTEWQQRPIHGLPRYNDRVGSRELVFTDTDGPLPIRPIDLPVPQGEEGDALGSRSVRVVGFLRYAQMGRRWHDGDGPINPVADVNIFSDHGGSQHEELFALDRSRRRSTDGIISFRWLNDFAATAALPRSAVSTLHIEVPASKIALDVPLTPESVVDDNGPFTPIKGTEFSYRVATVANDLSMGDGRFVSVAMVDVKTAEGQFRRMVADTAERTKDMHGDDPNPHAEPKRTAVPPDPRIVMTYQPESSPIILAAYPGGLFLVVNGAAGRTLGRDIEVGESVSLATGLNLRVESYWPRAVGDVKPTIVAEHRRQRKVGEMFSMIRLEVDTGRRVEYRWLRFNQYALPDDTFVYGGRFAYTPEHMRLDDGTEVEVLFSRERRKLPAPVALESFELDTHIGGYSGAASTIRNYVSRLRFRDGGGWTEPVAIEVNAPTEFDGYWFFQSMWDKPPRGNAGGGMNYTGLGVGNRNGVYIQLAGCCIAVAGMLFAFYVKPTIKRRRHDAARRRISPGAGQAVPEQTNATASETVQV